MKISRFLYGLLVALLVWSYFQPWTILGGQSFPGWSTLLISIGFFVGLVLSIIVLFTGYRATGMSILSGLFMFGNNLILGVGFGLLSLDGKTKFGDGFAYAFFLSLIFLILGPIFGSRFTTSSNVHVSGESYFKRIVIGVVVAVLVAFILKTLHLK